MDNSRAIESTALTSSPLSYCWILWLILSSGSTQALSADDTARDQSINLQDPVARLFNDNCAVCHGETLRGAAQGVALVGRDLSHGDSVPELIHSISKGVPERQMPAWASVLDGGQIRALAVYVSELRAQFSDIEFTVGDPIIIPRSIVESQEARFRVETFVDKLDPLPYALAFLPDGNLLVTEKHAGLSVISPAGKKSIVTGTPRIRARDEKTLVVEELDYSNGWMLDVAVHPHFEQNGWIYLSYGDQCLTCIKADPEDANAPSMTKLIRGRIRGGAWVDEQVIWSAEPATYSQVSDMVSGGRIAFDDAGHVYLTVGMRNFDQGVQDLTLPYGKIHRLHDDGRIPDDNPFVSLPGAVKSIWSYGHRNPQGLVFNLRTHELWSSEHGPRGGDEINLILRGRNYGWPLYSLGVNYDGTPVDGWKKLGPAFDLESIEQPVVDLTPSPAVSSFTFYQGSAFPRWQDDLIIGTLKARELYRVVLTDNMVVEKEVLLENIGRIRDLKEGADGCVYLLIEHRDGGRVLRLKPAGAVDANLAASSGTQQCDSAPRCHLM